MIQVKKYNAFITESKTEAIYNDYPAAAKANAKKAIEWRDKHGRDEVDGGTEVGWARANQLAKGEKLSRDVVSRMAQFNRHRKNSKVSAEYKDEPWKDKGYIAWLIWGGDEGVDWAMAKMDEIEKEETNEKVDLDKVEKYADKVMSPTDVEFTKHFYDQLTRAEHDKAITDAELIGFFKRLAKKKKEFDKFKQDYDQFVAKDSRSEINIPFKNKVDQIIAKTVMRKSDFKTSNAEYTFENNMKHVKLFEQFVTENKFPGKKGEFIYNDREGYVEIKKTAGQTAYVKWSYTSASAFNQVWADEVKLSDEKHKGKRVWLMESAKALNEGFWSGYEYKKWVKANGKIKYPKWIQEQMKEIIEGGFMDPVYDAEHNYIYLWWNSLTDDQKFNSDKRKKALGDVAAKLINDHYNDITGYTAFFFEGAAIALDLSKQVEDKLANGEAVEPAYYLAKEYFKNIGKDYNRSRVFNAAHEKLAEWMKLKGVETL